MHSKQSSALRAAFPLTLPVMAGYLVLGMGFGILLQSKGYHFGWAILMSLTIYAGSMQYVAVDLLSFMYAWNEYTYTVIFTRTAVNNTVPLALALLNTEDNLTNFGLVAAGGVVSVIPITLFVIFAQNYLISGLSSGAVKE